MTTTTNSATNRLATRMSRLSHLSAMIARRKAEARRIELEERDRMLREAREVHGTEQWWDWQVGVHLDWWVENNDLATTAELVKWGKASGQWYRENGKGDLKWPA